MSVIIRSEFFAKAADDMKYEAYVEAGLDMYSFPPQLIQLIKDNQETTCLSGSFVTKMIMEVKNGISPKFKPNDFDIFTTDPEVAKQVAVIMATSFTQRPECRKYSVSRSNIYGDVQLTPLPNISVVYQYKSKHEDNVNCNGTLQVIVLKNCSFRSFISRFDLSVNRVWFDGHDVKFATPEIEGDIRTLTVRVSNESHDIRAANGTFRRMLKYKERGFNIIEPMVIYLSEAIYTDYDFRTLMFKLFNQLKEDKFHPEDIEEATKLAKNTRVSYHDNDEIFRCYKLVNTTRLVRNDVPLAEHKEPIAAQ